MIIRHEFDKEYKTINFIIVYFIKILYFQFIYVLTQLV